jgi:hypothetical protein
MIARGVYPGKVANRGDISEQGWREFAVSNRERIRHLEDESKRLRERVHTVESEVLAFRFLGDKLSALTGELHSLAQQVEQVSRRAMERPTAAIVGQYLGLIVAVVALAIAATR